MREFLYGVVELIAKAHEKLLTINDRYEYNLSDKELHFIGSFSVSCASGDPYRTDTGRRTVRRRKDPGPEGPADPARGQGCAREYAADRRS